MESSSKLNKKDVEDIIGLSPMQEGILFHYLLSPETEQYFEQYSFSLAGDISLPVFEKAWNYVVETNEMLRTVYRWKNLDKPVQIILKSRQVIVKYEDISVLESEEKERVKNNFKVEDKKQGFDLEDGPLFRVYLLKTGYSQYEMIVSNHHILFDGWSYMLLLKDFFKAYNHFLTGTELETLKKTKFKDYLKWLGTLVKSSEEIFWKEYLKGYKNQALLPLDDIKKRNMVTAKNIICKLNKDLTCRLKSFAVGWEVTLGTVFTAAWGLLLQKYNSTNDVVFGTTVSGRSNTEMEGIQNIVGLMINTVPVRVCCSKNEKVGEMLQKISKNTNERQSYEATPLIDIISYIDLDKRQSLFDSIIVIENYPFEELRRSGTGLKITGYQGYGVTNYDLALAITWYDEIEINFIYNSDVFEEVTIELLKERYIVLLENMSENKENYCNDMEFLIEEEKKLLIRDEVFFDYCL